MQSSETPGYQKVTVDMTPDVNIQTDVNIPKMNLDLDSIQKAMDTDQWLLLVGTSILGGLAQAVGMKVGDKIFSAIGRDVNKLKLRTKAYDFEGMNFNKDLQEYNRINLGYEKVQQEIDRQKETLKQLDQKAGQNINQKQKEDLSELEFNLHQSQYDTAKNFINKWSYSPEDLAKMQTDMDGLQTEIDNIKGDYGSDEFVIYPEEMRKKARKWKDKYNISLPELLNQKWSDLHNYLNKRSDIVQADKDSILRLNQEAEMFRQQEQDSRKQRYSKDRLPDLQFQLDTIKAAYDKGVKPQLYSWLDHFNVDNKDQLIKKIYTSFQDDGVDPLAQDIYDYNWEINDQSLHTHPTSKQTKYYKPDNYNLHDYIRTINGDIEQSYEQINTLDRMYNVYWKDHIGEGLQETKGKEWLKMPTAAEEKMIKGLQKRINTISPALKKLAEFIRVNDITDSEAVIASDILDSLEGGKYYKGKPIDTDIMMKLYETNDNILHGLVDELKQYEPQMNFMNRQNYKLPELKEAIDQLFFNGEKKTQDEKPKRMRNSHGFTIYVEVPQFAPKIYLPETVEYDTRAQTMNKLKELGYDRHRTYTEAEFDKVPSNKSLANDERVNKALTKLYNNTLESLRTAKTVDYPSIIDQYNTTRQDILKGSKQYVNDVMKFSDEPPKNVKINELLLKTMDGSYEQYSEFTQDIMKQAEQYYKKKKNYKTFKDKYPNIQNQNQFLSQVSKNLNNLANAPIDDIAIKNFDDFINSFKVNAKEPINPNTLDMRSRGQSWKDYLKEYNIKYDMPVQEIGSDKQLHYNRDRHTFQVEDGGDNLDDILQDYIKDTYKNPKDFLRLDSKTKQNIMRQILEDDIISKSDNPIFKDFKDLVFVKDERPVLQEGIYDTSKLQEQTQNLLKMWEIDDEMNKFNVHRFDEQQGMVGKVIDWGVDKLAQWIKKKYNPQEFVGTTIDRVIESNPISRVIAEITLGATREERMRKYDYVYDKIKDWIKESI